MALKRKLQIILDSVAPEIHNLWLRPIDDLRWELNFFNGSIWRPLDITYFRIEDRNKLDYVFEFVDTLTPDHFGLGEVDNTSDLNKPISIATQTALNHKLNTPSPGKKETGVDAGVFGELSIDGEFLYFCTQSGNSSTAVWVPLQSAEDIATALSEAISDHQHSVEDITDIGDIATINKSGGTTQFLRGDGTWQSPPVTTVNGYTGRVTITPTDLGLEEVENKNVETILSELTFSNVTTALGFTPLNSVLKGAVNGLAELNESGVIPASQLPSFVDDVIEYDSLDLFPQEGTTGKIYVAKNTNLTYRWSGTGYINLDTSLALGITAETAYRGDYGNTAYLHSQVVDGTNPHQITFSNLVNKPTTISGYGITDSLVYTNDSRLSDARNANDVYTWAKEENKPSYTYDEVGAAPTTHDHVVGDITNFPTSLPASDVSSWAKAENKPSYTFSEIGSHPTTLSGYGITDATPSSHIGATGNAHGVATSEINGFMSTDDKVKLTNIAENANNYSHPTGDGNLHVPETGTTNNGKVLKAGGTAGSISWENDIDTITSINGKTGAITKEDITALGIPAQDTVYIHPDSHPATIITQTSDYRFVTDTEKGVWNNKENLSNKVTSIDGASTDIQYPSAKVVYNKLAEKENLSNKLTSATGINSAATDLQYPSAKAVFNALTEVITNFVTSTPEGVREDIAELEADFPTGATGIWIVKDTGHWYFYAAENWIDGGLYQSPLDVVQTTGTSETDVMSQKAVTDELALKVDQTELAQLVGDVKDTTEKACASSLAELNARLLALEKIVSSSLRSTIEVTREFNVWGKTNLNLSGNGAPAFAPDFIGQRYTDITGQNVYDAVGTTTAGDWKLS